MKKSNEIYNRGKLFPHVPANSENINNNNGMVCGNNETMFPQIGDVVGNTVWCRALIAEVEARGCDIEAHGTKIRITPPGKVPAHVLGYIKEYKPMVISLLRLRSLPESFQDRLQEVWDVFPGAEVVAFAPRDGDGLQEFVTMDSSKRVRGNW